MILFELSGVALFHKMLASCIAFGLLGFALGYLVGRNQGINKRSQL